MLLDPVLVRTFVFLPLPCASGREPMSDRYDEGYARAEAVYRQRFNFRYELLHDTKQIWEDPKMDRIKDGLFRLWPELANQLNEIADQAGQMRSEFR